MAKKSAAAAVKARASRSPHLIVSQPVPVLERDLKADGKGLFKALGRSVAHLGTGKVWELAGDASEAAAALGLKTDAGGLAWHLIRQSLLRAMHGLVEEAWLHRAENAPAPSDELAESVVKEVSKAELEVSPDFFRQPGSLPFLAPCAAWFEQWLKGIGFEIPTAASIASRLRSYFVFALNQEWRAHPELYAPIISAATTPFSRAGEREAAWDQYRAWLDHELELPMFSEPFSLRQLYIPLRAYYLQEVKEAAAKDAPPAGGSGEGRKKRIAVDLTSTLLHWVTRNEKDDAVRILSGGPGSGKSSVAKMFTAQALAHTSWRALYLPLHRIKYKGDIIPAIHEYLRDTRLLPGAATPLDTEAGEPQLLLIFDGLDELAMLGKIAQETAGQFVRAVKELVSNQNTTALRLKVILTGRTLTMQSLETEFRREGAVLHLCPYFVEPTDEEQKLYSRGWDLLKDADQRQEWWQKYGVLTGKGYAGLPEKFNRQDLVEVSSEPLLNYLLALAEQTDMLNFDQQVTQNQIYASLIHEVYDRRWAGGENFHVKGMSEDHFHRVLEEVAVAAWHGDGRKTTVGEIKKHCQVAGIDTLLNTLQDGAESGVLKLLTAFFFRQAGDRNDENAFEFTHKSFGEYLVARRIVRLLGDMAKKTREQKQTFDGWSEPECLVRWARLCGPTAMTARQWEFLKNEMHFAKAFPAEWQGLLVALINTLLRHGMPMEKLDLASFKTMREQSRNAEEGLLLALNACAEFTETLSGIDWPEPASAVTWIRHLQSYPSADGEVLALAGLGYVDLHEQSMTLADLYGANLANSDLSGCSLAYALLMGANLSSTNLTGASLGGASLHEANLSGADLDGAHLSRADLSGADLSGADLSGADLSGADLSGAGLSGSDLSGSDLRRANLSEANLRGANFSGADLSGANLVNANLRRADLSGASLTGASLKRCTLTGAIGLPPHLAHLAEEKSPKEKK